MPKSYDQWRESARQMNAKPQIVESLIPDEAGISLLVGRTGIGKTNLVFQLCGSIATGVPFFNFRTSESKVAYIGFEGDSSLAARLDKLERTYDTAKLKKNFFFDIWDPSNIERHYYKFKEELADVRLGVLDPLKFLVPGDYTKVSDANKATNLILQLAHELGIHLLLPHHIRKPNEASLIHPGDVYEAKGATEFVDSSTTVMLLERQPQQHVQGRRGYMPRNDTIAELHFPKTRISPFNIDKKTLMFDHQKLTFLDLATEIVI